MTINGASQNATIGASGAFSVNFSTATIPASASAYTITYAYAGNTTLNAAANDTSRSLTVNRRALTITANNDSKTYGQSRTYGSGSTAFASSGLQNSETIGTVTITASGGAAANAAAGSYTLTPSAATGGTFNANNYTVTYATGTLTVVQAALTITASNDSKTYGGTKTYGTGQTTFTSSGLQNSETIGTVTITASGGTAANAAVGSYTLTPSAATGGSFTASNYSITYATGTLTVGQAPLAITANNDSKTYGGTKTYGTGQTTFTSSGLQNSETIGSVTITASGGTAANAAVGSYTLTPSAATGGSFTPGNYAITYATGTLTVGQAPLTITASNDSKTYGQTKTYGPGSTAFTSSGLQNSESIGTVTITASGGTAANAAVGSYTLTPSAATGGSFTPGNYAITYATGTLTVSQAPLTITASNDSKTYGQTKTYGPGSTAFTSSGLQNSESIGTVTITASGGTAANADVGSYTLTPSAAAGGSFSAGNYSITYVNGTLTVSTKALPITGLTAVTKFYDGTAAATYSGTAGFNTGDLVTGDTGLVTLSGTAVGAFADATIANGKTVSYVSGLSLGGTRGFNYAPSVASQSANIVDTTPANVTTVNSTPTTSAINLTVNQGTLVAANTSGSINGSGTVTVTGTGKLTGSGRVGSLVVQSGGTMNPGTSPGKLTASSATWGPAGIYEWEINDGNATAGSNPGWDLLEIDGGTLDITATSGSPYVIQLTTLNGSSAGKMADFQAKTPYTWVIARAINGGSISGFAANKFSINTSGFQNFTSSGTFAVVQSGSEIQVTFTPVACAANQFTTKTWSAVDNLPTGDATKAQLVITFVNSYGISNVAGFRLKNVTLSATAYDAGNNVLGTFSSISDVWNFGSSSIDPSVQPVALPDGTVKVVAVGTVVDETQRAACNARVSDLCGSTFATLDPVLTTVRVDGSGVTRQTFEKIPAFERYVTVDNRSPGLRRLTVTVNGQPFVLDSLQDGERRTLDIGEAMTSDEDNVVELLGEGVAGASAQVLIADNTLQLVGALPGTGLLRIEASNGGWKVSWPETFSSWKLQGSESLGGEAQWTEVPGQPAIEGGRASLMVPNGSGQQFFRLERP